MFGDVRARKRVCGGASSSEEAKLFRPLIRSASLVPGDFGGGDHKWEMEVRRWLRRKGKIDRGESFRPSVSLPVI